MEDNSGHRQTRTPKRIRERLRHVWKIISKAGLFLFFVLYTIAGAKVFQILEHPSEVERQKDSSILLVDARKRFLRSLLNVSASTTDAYLKKVSSNLKAYESVVELAERDGLSPLEPEAVHYKWNFIQSVFFASTIITTIGYGNMAPITTNGRVFCILYGFVGIPVTLTVIADLGTFFANIISAIYEKIKKCLHSLNQFQPSKSSVGDNTKRGLIVLGSVLSLLIYISVGARLFITWEDWTFFEAFYFGFITMTTIGLGDLVPEKTEFMLVCTLYILIGLALTSTIIELVRRQYAESWQQMKELSGRLGELSGPLADQLRKLGQHDLNLDLRINPDLKELMNAIQLNRLEALYKLEPKWKNDKNFSEFLKSYLGGPTQTKDVEAEEEEFIKKKKVIQVIIYESSV